MGQTIPNKNEFHSRTALFSLDRCDDVQMRRAALAQHRDFPIIPAVVIGWGMALLFACCWGDLSSFATLSACVLTTCLLAGLATTAVLTLHARGQ